jgi:hypothetical protein
MGWFDRFRRRGNYQRMNNAPSGDYSSYGNTSRADALADQGAIDIKQQSAHPWGSRDAAARDYVPNLNFRNAAGAVAGGLLGNRMGRGLINNTLGANAPWQAQAVGNIGGALGGAFLGGTEWGRANTIGRIPLINRIPGMPNINRYREQQQVYSNEDQARLANEQINARDAIAHQRVRESGVGFSEPELARMRAKGYSNEDIGYAWQARQVQDAALNRELRKYETAEYGSPEEQDATNWYNRYGSRAVSRNPRVQDANYLNPRSESTYSILQTLDPNSAPTQPVQPTLYTQNVNPQTGVPNETPQGNAQDLNNMPPQAFDQYLMDNVNALDNNMYQPTNQPQPVQPQPAQSQFSWTSPSTWGWFGGGS